MGFRGVGGGKAKDTIVVCANESEHNPQHCVPKTLTEACQKTADFCLRTFILGTYVPY